ncbi:sce7726 family protein [Sulfurovum sp.]|uniref:sce7726 family protein n=1 Tax=Sulfurovum sp. TaxID=1969726 RepID=UPI003563C249
MNDADIIKIELYKYLFKYSTSNFIAVPEVSISNNISDMLVTNGNIHNFEIKSKSDSLKRLSQQIATFKKYSNLVTIVAHDKFIKKILSDPQMDGIGIISVNDKNKLTTLREPEYRDIPAPNYLAYFNTSELRETLRGVPQWYKLNFIDAEKKLLELLTEDEVRRLTLFRIKEKYSQEFAKRRSLIKEKKELEALQSRFKQYINVQVTPLTDIPYKVFRDFNY